MSERDEFEAWFEREYPVDARRRRTKYRQTPVIDLMFSAYQAARAPQAVPPLTDSDKFFAATDDRNMTARLQDLGYEFGCPPGIKIIDWLRIQLASMREAFVLSGDEVRATPQPVGVSALTEEQIQAVLQKLNPAWWDVPQGATEAFARAILAAPQPSPEPERAGLCGYMDCDDEGMIDSGGVTPWGEWIRVPCPICNGAQSFDEFSETFKATEKAKKENP